PANDLPRVTSEEPIAEPAIPAPDHRLPQFWPTHVDFALPRSRDDRFRSMTNSLRAAWRYYRSSGSRSRLLAGFIRADRRAEADAGRPMRTIDGSPGSRGCGMRCSDDANERGRCAQLPLRRGLLRLLRIESGRAPSHIHPARRLRARAPHDRRSFPRRARHRARWDRRDAARRGVVRGDVLRAWPDGRHRRAVGALRAPVPGRPAARTRGPRHARASAVSGRRGRGARRRPGARALAREVLPAGAGRGGAVSEPPGALAGLRVVSFEARRADELASMFARHGATVVRAPALREAPLPASGEALELARRLEAGEVAALVLLTGVGTRALVYVLAGAYPGFTALLSR